MNRPLLPMPCACAQAQAPIIFSLEGRLLYYKFDDVTLAYMASRIFAENQANNNNVCWYIFGQS